MVIWYFCHLTIILCNLEGLCFFENCLQGLLIWEDCYVMLAIEIVMHFSLQDTFTRHSFWILVSLLPMLLRVCDKKQTEWPFCSKSPNMTWSVAFTWSVCIIAAWCSCWGQLNAFWWFSDQRNAQPSSSQWKNYFRKVLIKLAQVLAHSTKHCTLTLSVGLGIPANAATLVGLGSAPLSVSLCPMKEKEGDFTWSFFTESQIWIAALLKKLCQVLVVINIFLKFCHGNWVCLGTNRSDKTGQLNVHRTSKRFSKVSGLKTLQ